MFRSLLFLTLLATPASAQLLAQSDFPPPPLVPAGPPPAPAPEPGSKLIQPGTPPPPSATPPDGAFVPPVNGYTPGQPQTGYPYSPYGDPQPKKDEKPPLEWGLMLSESLFGMLTSAAISLIPYYLMLHSMVDPSSSGGVIFDPTIGTVIFILIFAAVPLAVSQTMLSLANGSRYYFTEAWIPSLVGLAAEAAVLGLFFLTAPRIANTPPTQNGSEGLLLVGSVVFTPLVQMAVINLTKSPRLGRVAAISNDGKGGLALGVPSVTPLLGATRVGTAVGLQAQLVSLRF